MNGNIQQLQNQLRKENLAYGKRMQVFLDNPNGGKNEPIRVWRSNRFLVQLFQEATCMRLTVNRTSLNHTGGWEDGITWDELQSIKRECGFGGRFAVEVFPADEHFVNDHNMRHLWLLKSPPPFAWTVIDSEVMQ